MKALVFDTETTGLIKNRLLHVDKQSEIIEFYCCFVDFDEQCFLDEAHFLFKPQRPVSDDLVKKLGITNDMLENKGRFRDQAQTIKERIEFAPTIIAHNLSFDQEMVELEFERLGEPPPTWPAPLCIVEQTVHLKGYRLSLTELHQHLFGEPFLGAHRANIDTQALIRCCFELYQRGLL